MGRAKTAARKACQKPTRLCWSAALLPRCSLRLHRRGFEVLRKRLSHLERVHTARNTMVAVVGFTSRSTNTSVKQNSTNQSIPAEPGDAKCRPHPHDTCALEFYLCLMASRRHM